MQQGVQTDATCNIQQCWGLLANNVASVWTGLKMRRRRESQISNSLTKQNNNFARASRSFVHFFTSNARLPVKMPNFTFCQQWQNSFSSWTQLSMSTHISKLCSSAFFHLHYISRIRKFLSPGETKSLVHAFVTSRVDYCNSLLYGLPASQLNKVQRVLNTAARLVCCAPRFSHITPLMYELHWLPLKQRIHFKILLFAFKAIHV